MLICAAVMGLGVSTGGKSVRLWALLPVRLVEAIDERANLLASDPELLVRLLAKGRGLAAVYPWLSCLFIKSQGSVLQCLSFIQDGKAVAGLLPGFGRVFVEPAMRVADGESIVRPLCTEHVRADRLRVAGGRMKEVSAEDQQAGDSLYVNSIHGVLALPCRGVFRTAGTDQLQGVFSCELVRH